jgi:uncharacterized membrane protein YuzA (DUF378 family)
MPSGKLDWIVRILLVIGGLNWGLAIWDINLVPMIFVLDWLVTTVYALVGLSALYEIYALVKK